MAVHRIVRTASSSVVDVAPGGKPVGLRSRLGPPSTGGGRRAPGLTICLEACPRAVGGSDVGGEGDTTLCDVREGQSALMCSGRARPGHRGPSRSLSLSGSARPERAPLRRSLREAGGPCGLVRIQAGIHQLAAPK